MRPINVSIILAISVVVLQLSCYTVLRAPHTVNENAELGEVEDESSEDSVPSLANPSVPDSRLHDYDWFYYYQSVWWLDAPQPTWEGESGRPDPEEYRRRFPQGNYMDGVTVTAPSTTYSAPSLSKTGENPPSSSPDSASSEVQRRAFNSGSYSSSSSPTPAATGSDNGAKRDFEAGSHSKPNDKDQPMPKRK